jgi:hypothetical protein
MFLCSGAGISRRRRDQRCAPQHPHAPAMPKRVTARVSIGTP